jgi:hypothetical protein
MNQNLSRAFLRPLLLVLLLGLLIACLKVTVGWWRGELDLAEDGNWLWLVLFPILLAIWWRYFSVFGCKEPACLLPKDEDR